MIMGSFMVGRLVVGRVRGTFRMVGIRWMMGDMTMGNAIMMRSYCWVIIKIRVIGGKGKGKTITIFL